MRSEEVKVLGAINEYFSIEDTFHGNGVTILSTFEVNELGLDDREPTHNQKSSIA